MPTFDTPKPITATIDLGLGDVRIRATGTDTTVVEVQPSDASSEKDRKAAELTRVEYAHGQLVVKASKLRTWLTRDGGSIDVTIELPAGSHVHGGLAAADVHGVGRLGQTQIKTGLGRVQLDEVETLHLKSGTGDITVDRVTGHADVTAGSGDVRARVLDSTAVVKNSNGDIWIGMAEGDLRASAANGSIVVDVANAGVVAKSANGDVRVREVVHGSVVAETRLGDVEVGIREGTAAWLDARSRAGSVLNALEASDAPGDATDAVEVRGRTTVGDIMIQRARGAVPRLPYVS
jgi:DUF4097 and DUF4098 domain-containing protein YvlB